MLTAGVYGCRREQVVAFEGHGCAHKLASVVYRGLYGSNFSYKKSANVNAIVRLRIKTIFSSSTGLNFDTVH